MAEFILVIRYVMSHGPWPYCLELGIDSLFRYPNRTADDHTSSPLTRHLVFYRRPLDLPASDVICYLIGESTAMQIFSA